MSNDDELRAAIKDLKGEIERSKEGQRGRRSMMVGLDPNSSQAKEHIKVIANLAANIASIEQKIRQLQGQIGR